MPITRSETPNQASRRRLPPPPAVRKIYISGPRGRGWIGVRKSGRERSMFAVEELLAGSRWFESGASWNTLCGFLCEQCIETPTQDRIHMRPTFAKMALD